MNFARINHILIPTKKEERDRLRRGLAGRLMRPFMWMNSALSSEGRVLSLMLMLIALSGLDVNRSQVYLLWAVFAGLLVSSLFVRHLFSAKGLSVAVRTPARVAVGEALRLDVELHNAGKRDLQAVRVLRPFLPWDGQWATPRGGVASVAVGATETWSTRARFVQRGEHHLDGFAAAQLVPLGLALGPPVDGPGAKFLVVPRSANVVGLGVSLAPRTQVGGAVRRARGGDATELCGVRPYRAGDPIRDLHAKTWARVGVPHVREYQEERMTRAAVIVDLCVGDASEELVEALISLAAAVPLKMYDGDATVDVLVLDEDPELLVVGRGVSTTERVLDRLAVAGVAPRFSADEALAHWEGRLPELCALVVLTVAPGPEHREVLERARVFGIETRCVTVVAREPSEVEALGPVVSASVIHDGGPVLC